jgi:hypothetical protein
MCERRAGRAILWLLGAVSTAACRPGDDYTVRFVKPNDEHRALEVLETYLLNDGCRKVGGKINEYVLARFDCLDKREYEVFLEHHAGTVVLSFVSAPYERFKPSVTCRIERALHDLSIEYGSAYKVVSRVDVPECDEDDR